MADNKTLWQVLEEYCADLKYGEINLKIVVHDGKAISFDETQSPIRRFKVRPFENNK